MIYVTCRFTNEVNAERMFLILRRGLLEVEEENIMAQPLFTLSTSHTRSTSVASSHTANQSDHSEDDLHHTPYFPNTPVPGQLNAHPDPQPAFQQRFAQLQNTSRKLQTFFLVALIALIGWVIVQTLFSMSPFGKAQPFIVLSIEFVWWLSLLTLLAYLFRRVLSNLTFSTYNLGLVKQQLDTAHEEILQKNVLLEQSIKDVWAARRRYSLPANVVSPGHYQIQDLFGGYRDVRVQNESGGHKLVCDCYVYKKDGICTHTIAAASLHLRICSILRHRVPEIPETYERTSLSRNEHKRRVAYQA